MTFEDALAASRAAYARGLAGHPTETPGPGDASETLGLYHRLLFCRTCQGDGTYQDWQGLAELVGTPCLDCKGTGTRPPQPGPHTAGRPHWMHDPTRTESPDANR